MARRSILLLAVGLVLQIAVHGCSSPRSLPDWDKLQVQESGYIMSQDEFVRARYPGVEKMPFLPRSRLAQIERSYDRYVEHQLVNRRLADPGTGDDR